MTLKSLNIQYLKLIRKMAVMGAGLLLVTVTLLSPMQWCVKATGFNRHPTEANNSIPSLQDEAAITYLKEHNLYDSLRGAQDAARTQQSDNSVVAPLFVNKQKLTTGVHSVAFSGSTIVVGAWRDGIGGNPGQGSASVFIRQGGSWVEAQKLTASDGAADDNFGISVAFSGSSIVVGAWRDDIGGNPDQGSAYVFNLQDGNWVETQKLTASDGAAGDNFGFSVAFGGSTVIVGAVGHNTHQGSTYIFNRQAENWVEAQQLIASDGAVNDVFGWSVAVSGSTIVVSSPGDDSAHIFNRQGGGWVETQKLTTSDGSLGDFFGYSVAISGSTIVVGAPFDDIPLPSAPPGGAPDLGSASVFNRRGENWVEAQKLTASDGGLFDFFGWSVAISGSTIVVGAPFKNIDSNFDQGSAYVFNRQGADWVMTQKLTASDGRLFGFAVAVSGSTVVVGAEGSRSVYIFEP